MPNKSKNLQILKKNNFLVPIFITLNTVDNFQEKVLILDKTKKYAIRSDMLVEDSTNSSFAGQFKTFINIKYSEIIKHIEKVINHAKNYWLKDNQISVIIQEYIVLEYSWIAFSRNPNWNREMVIEYHKWIWEDIVSWKIIPTKINICHNTYVKEDTLSFWIKGKMPERQIWILKKLPNFIEDIENIFSFPQDIEWWIANWQIYFLQSRNITSITKEKYDEILFLEKELELNKKFFYEKNEVSEIAPRPVNFTYNLLETLYSKDWPINNFYKKNNISMSTEGFNPLNDNNILKIIWNELYINKEIELKSIFPSFSYLKNNTFTISFDTFSWFFTTLKNFYNLSFIKYNKLELSNKLKNKLQTNISTEGFSPLSNLKKSLSNFLEDYSLIYEINFFTWKSFNKLEKVLKKESLTFSEAINLNLSNNTSTEGFNPLNSYDIDTSDFIWNSLDLSDSSIFKNPPPNPLPSKEGESVQKWNCLPEWKKKFLTPYLKEANYMQDLREKWRYLTVKHITNIRKILDKIWKENKINNIYFTNIQEIIKWNINKDILNKREKIYNNFNKYTSPEILRSRYIENKWKRLIWISSWIIEWKIVSKETIEEVKWKKILLVDILSPNLVEYFDSINWIISKTWWTLSHLGIMAREKWIPVISWYYDELNLTIWDKVKIDWWKWEIKKL